jgi:hypothetical protein
VEPVLPVTVGLNAVIVTVTDEVPRVLVVSGGEHPTAAGPADLPAGDDLLDTLPYGPLDPDRDRTLELALRRWVREQTGIEHGYVEQLYTFGDRDRDPTSSSRLISVAYLGLIEERETSGAGEARWRDWYELFPWEDWREGRPGLIEDQLAPALERWAEAPGDPAARRRRRERRDITFGLGGAPWDGERTLERYELLYEAALVREAMPDRRAGSGAEGPGPAAGVGRPMALDHRRIAAVALGRLRGKLTYRPVVFELLPPEFTLLQLQRVVEALAGVRLHKQNFRRLVERGGLVERTGRLDRTATVGRPAELVRFRDEVLRERPAPGVGLPGMGRTGE